MGFGKLGNAAIGSIAGGAVMGPIGSVIGAKKGDQIVNGLNGGDIPQRQIVDLDEGSKGLIAQKQKEAAQTPEEYANQMTAGTQEAGQNFYNGSQGMGPNLGGDLDANSQAISERFNRKMGDNNAALQSQVRAQAPKVQLNAQQQALQAAKAQQQVQIATYTNELKRKADKKAARSQLLGNVMGIGGSAIGMIVGRGNGAPKAGAAAGPGGGGNYGSGGNLGQSQVAQGPMDF